MARELKRIGVIAGSEIAKLLEAARLAPLLLENDGEVNRLGREETLWAGYHPVEARSALNKTAGSWADLDADELVAELYRTREEGSRPASRP